MPKVVIFTDLDATLLDHNTYSFKAAAQALELIKSKQIPLILCSSKVRAEIEYYQDLLNIKCPFISENGGGIFIPKDYFSLEFRFDRELGNYKVVELGTQREKLIQTLESISKQTGVKIRGFSQMSVSEIAQLSGLDENIAKLAVQRDYSEPCIIDNDEENNETIAEEINLNGYRHTRGGRFHHILGGNDKGKAVEMLTNIYRAEFVDVKTVALGDSLNDLPMLKVVDIPILVQKPAGSYDPGIKLTNLTYADGIGPSGWNSSILKLFMNFE
ncbi:MAG: mannosyl-3-phosphoglycerate phosphatase [Thermodesulfobacteriota bacterium]